MSATCPVAVASIFLFDTHIPLTLSRIPYNLVSHIWCHVRGELTLGLVTDHLTQRQQGRSAALVRALVVDPLEDGGGQQGVEPAHASSSGVTVEQDDESPKQTGSQHFQAGRTSKRQTQLVAQLVYARPDIRNKRI